MFNKGDWIRIDFTVSNTYELISKPMLSSTNKVYIADYKLVKSYESIDIGKIYEAHPLICKFMAYKVIHGD